ncbi:MAG: protein translocase subunit SecD [Candidatus Accumulibacter sp.]|jgi:preprotein translocase subunit SecD|nr:protein translocase subunit SecD [Accumulibacter sp.]
MNRYPLWKYIIVVIALLFGLVYTLPNFFGESPAVQISSAKVTFKVDTATLERVESTLKAAGIATSGVFLDATGVKVRLEDIDTQLKAKDILERQFNPDPADPRYMVALNLLSRSPRWLGSLGALPMYLGLDLRGGVHFLLQVDMKSVQTKQLDATVADLRGLLRDKTIRHGGVGREGERVVVRFSDEETRARARGVIEASQPDLALADQGDGDDLRLIATLKPAALAKLQESAVKQNISTLNNRVNETGVAEPVIQQQGADRIVVQLPGVQDTTRVKDMIGRTATLEVRLVDEDATLKLRTGETARSGAVFGVDIVPERNRDGSETPVALKKQVVITGDHLTGADATFDQDQRPAVSVTLDAVGGRVMRDVTRVNLKKQMAIVLYEKGKGEAISVATIQGEFGSRFQITGSFSAEETTRLAILIRAGALAAPMEIIEERTIGPSLGADHIEQGFRSTLWGFVAIAAFMIVYYVLFGFISVLALASNLLFLVALLSLLQATLTLPGIAAIALTLGMAIDANVLINERIREELRAGSPPQAAIHIGYDRAFDTIIDSNITTLVVGLMLLVFGSGPVRGFAVVHCLGILTSLFSAVVVSRALVNLIHGRRRKLESLSIGQIWKPGASLPAGK